MSAQSVTGMEVGSLLPSLSPPSPPSLVVFCAGPSFSIGSAVVVMTYSVLFQSMA